MSVILFLLLILFRLLLFSFNTIYANVISSLRLTLQWLQFKIVNHLQFVYAKFVCLLSFISKSSLWFFFLAKQKQNTLTIHSHNLPYFILNHISFNLFRSNVSDVLHFVDYLLVYVYIVYLCTISIFFCGKINLNFISIFETNWIHGAHHFHTSSIM